MSKLYLIVNPHGGHKKGLAILEMVKPVFFNAGFELDIKETQRAKHAQEMANSMQLEGYSCLCAIGGDGTMHEVVNGLFSRGDGKKIPIGLIPAGTGNAFMHSLNCLDPIEAAKRIVAQKKRKIDIARINANGEIIFAFNMLGWGMPGSVNILAEKLRVFGRQRYNIASLIEVMRNKRHAAKLSIGDQVDTGHYAIVFACNNQHTGVGMKVAPFAKCDDGLIDLLVVRNIGRFKILSLLSKVFDGSHVHESAVGYFQTDRFSITPEENSSLIVDGEITGSTPIQVQVINSGLEILM